MGIELARAASRLGHQVDLVCGPCSVAVPHNRRIRAVAVTTALEMRKEIHRVFPRVDMVIMASAVTDFRSERLSSHKIEKTRAEASLLKLVPNPDILAELGKRKGDRMLVGFSAETRNVTKNASSKLRLKNLDFIVANRVGGKNSAFGSIKNKVVVLAKDGTLTAFPTMSKRTLARKLITMFLRAKCE